MGYGLGYTGVVPSNVFYHRHLGVMISDTMSKYRQVNPETIPLM